MSKQFGIPIEIAVGMSMAAIIYFLAVHSPVLFALAVAWRQRKTMRRRILFVGTVMGATYGFIVLFFLAVFVPVSAFMVFVAPALASHGVLENALIFPVTRFAADWWWAILPLVILIPAIFISLYLAARWNRIAEAIRI
jgi:hypothetical protein